MTKDESQPIDFVNMTIEQLEEALAKLRKERRSSAAKAKNVKRGRSKVTQAQVKKSLDDLEEL